MAGHAGVGIAVFAVTDTGCQLVWRRLPVGRHRLAVGSHEVVVDGDGGPGAVWVDGLTPATASPVTLDGRPLAEAHTRPALAGPVRARVATISDLHVGQTAVGQLPRLRMPPNLRCVEAALEEIVAWGPDVLVVKGDVTEGGAARDWETVTARLEASGLPVVLTFGNHDVRSPGRADPRPLLASIGATVTPPHGTVHVDLPGLRVVVSDTTTADQHRGQLARTADDIVEAVTGAPLTAPALVALHHQLQHLSLPHHWPPGIPGREARHFLGRLAGARPVVVTSGHSHRHRARRSGQVVTTEVGSVKDYPGVWAAYEAHDGGLRQTVRRVAAPDVLRWTDRTASTALGVWGRWSPGRLSDRCLEVGR